MKVMLWITIACIYTIIVITGAFDMVDYSIYEKISGDLHPTVEVMMIGIASLADTEILALLSLTTVVILWIGKKLKWIVSYISIMSCGVIVTLILKLVIKRDRPGEEVSFIDFWGWGEGIISYSYPSGHGIKSLLFFMFWIIYLQYNYMKTRKLQITTYALFLIPILVGIAQIMLGRHYITDVIGGYLIGIAIITSCTAIFGATFFGARHPSNSGTIQKISI